jgi:hypothetical protein
MAAAPCRAGATARADIAVETTARDLRVLRRGAGGGGWRPMLAGTLRHAVEASSCCWSIEQASMARSHLVVPGTGPPNLVH